MAETRLLVLDVDGVLTDGTIYYSGEGESLKAFNAHDGYGLKLLMKAGVQVAIISGRTSAPLVRRVHDLGITNVRLASRDKAQSMYDLAGETGIDFRYMAFMGDDLLDLPAIRLAGRCFAPANAVPQIREIADVVTTSIGGRGAVREICDMLIKEAGHDIMTLAQGANGQ